MQVDKRLSRVQFEAVGLGKDDSNGRDARLVKDQFGDRVLYA